MKAKLSVLGLYQYDNTVFDDFALPERINRDNLINNLLLECAELTCIYPDTGFFKMALKSWSQMEISTWEWLLDTQGYDYNPIWNVDVKDSTRDDRKETRNLQGTNNETRNLQGTNNETKNMTTTDSGTIGTVAGGSDVQEVDVNAFNSGSGTRRETTTTRYGKTESETRNLQSVTSGTDNYSSTDTGTDNYISTDTGTVDNNTKIEFYKRGNQGVTTTQQMIREEQELAKFNIDDYIINEFKKRFCILLY